MKALILILVLLFSVPSHATTELGLTGFVKTLAAAGTAEPLSPSPMLGIDVLIQADPANTGNMILGGSNVLAATGNGIVLTPGDAVALNDLIGYQSGMQYDLTEIYLDAAVSGEKVSVTRVITR